MTLTITPVSGVGTIDDASDLVATFLSAWDAMGGELCHHDLVAVTSKVVAKAEGRVVAFDGTEEDKMRLIEAESRRILRRRDQLRITETFHGFVCANAGIDLSNTLPGTAVLLPLDPDRSARRMRAEFRRLRDVDVAVIVTDTFGRVWRNGVTDVAIGSAGVVPVLDLRGTVDGNGRVLEATEVAIVDEIAGAINLVLGKAANTPFAVARGLREEYFGEGSVKEHVVRSSNDDLFR